MVGDNEPYGLDPAQDYSTPEHAFSRGLDYLQVEFRQDLVATEAGQRRLALLFSGAVSAALAVCSKDRKGGGDGTPGSDTTW